MNLEKLRDGRYNYYAEQVTTFMQHAGLLVDEETDDFEQFIRGCA